MLAMVVLSILGLRIVLRTISNGSIVMIYVFRNCWLKNQGNGHGSKASKIGI